MPCEPAPNARSFAGGAPLNSPGRVGFWLELGGVPALFVIGI
jgi:hypothetical protein